MKAGVTFRAMAAGPADAFSATPCGFSRYDQELISAAADNLWSSNVVATASTGASWVDDVDVVGISAHHQVPPSQQNPNPHFKHMLPQHLQNGRAESLEEHLKELMRQFHRGRQLQVKYLPRECTEEVSEPL